CRTRIETLRKNHLRDEVRVLEDQRVRIGRTDRGNDALAHARDDGFFACATDEALDVSPNGNTYDCAQLYAVLRDCGNRRRLDHFRVHRHLHGFENVATGEIDSSGALEGKIDVGLIGRDERVHHLLNMTTGQVMSFELRRLEINARLVRRDEWPDDNCGRNVA